MKKLYLIALLCSLNSFAQFAIEKADGTKINASWVEFDHEDEKLRFIVSGAKKEKIKYKELKSVTSADYRFRIFEGGKKFKGYFVKAETPTKTLGYVSYVLTAGPSTGMQSSFEHVALAVFDNTGKLLEEKDLRQGKSGKNDKMRGSVVPMIKAHFSDCPNLIAKVSQYENMKDDEDNMQIFYYLKNHIDYIECN